MKFTDKQYNILKWIAMTVLPAFILFFKAVGGEVGFEYTEVIANILVALNAFLGSILGVSSANYHKEHEDEIY